MKSNSPIAEAVRIIHLEDNPHDRELVECLLSSSSCNFEFIRADDYESFSSALQKNADLILSDYSMPSYNGIKALQLAQEIRPCVPFIFFSGTIGEEAAISCLKKGAVDYVLKQYPDRLAAAVDRALVEATEKASRQSAEQKMREQAALLDKAQDAIFVCDLNEVVTYWNEGATRLYGWASNEVLGNSLDSFSSQLPMKPSVANQLFTTREWHGDVEHTTKRGEKIVVQSRLTLVTDAAGKPISILHIDTDITDKKQLEIQFLRSQRVENLGSIAGGVAHDLNNILSPIMMAVEVINRDGLAPADARLLDTIGANARRGAHLVQQILSFARGTGGEKSCLKMEAIISEVVRLTRDTFPTSILIQKEISKHVPDVMGDSTQIDQVLLNLCVNGRDAMMPRGGTLTIGARQTKLENKVLPGQPVPVSGEFAEIKVSDTGIGIPQAIRSRIFEPFFTTKEQGKGTGLGLSTVMKIVKNHGGFIDIFSVFGEGTTFSVYLPAAKQQRTLQQEPTENPLRGERENILVVDDESAIVEMMCTLLDAYNYRVVTASDGMEAIEVFTRYNSDIDVVITDMAMPGMEGNELVIELRKINPDVKVIAASGYSDEIKDENNLLNAILNKPFTTQQLFRTVRAVLKSGTQNL